MAIDPSQIVLQAVIEVSIPDPQGKNVKPRPVVVIGFDDEDDTVFQFCAISSTFPKPVPRECVPLPYSHQHGGHPSTGLYLESVAVCNWLDEAPKTDVVKKWGYLPIKTFNRVIERIEALEDDDESTDPASAAHPDP